MPAFPTALRYIVLAGGLLLFNLGCQGNWWERTAPPAGEPAKPSEPPKPVEELLADTIGAKCLLSNAEGMHVRGFSLVVGLGENGSSECPTVVREYLIDQLSRQMEAIRSDRRRPRFSPAEMIDSLDSAVVEVTGAIPGGAPRGTRFDLRVTALPGTETRSLEGGVLLPCELKLFDVSTGGEGLVAGRAVARGRGAVFTNPFVAQDTNPGDLRTGVVLGGGQSLDHRNLRLLMNEPSYAEARLIERRLNQRFGSRPRAAEAMSRGYVVLTTPAQFADRPLEFSQLVTHVYVPSHPSFYERRLRDLEQYVSEPGALHTRASLLWEGMGRVAVPHLQPLYQHSIPAVRYAAARAGLRLDDPTAAPALISIALDASHANRLDALRELARAERIEADSLLPLLDDSDLAVRVAAYETLRAHRHPAVQSRRIPLAMDPSQINLTLDLVRSQGEPFLYVRRSGEPRLAIFGPRIPITVPVFYSHPDEHVILSADNPGDELTVLSRTREFLRGRAIQAPPRVDALVTLLAHPPDLDSASPSGGLGLAYAQVVQVLAALIEDGPVSAKLVLEDESLPTPLTEPQPVRPEFDEPADDLEAPPAGDRPESSLDDRSLD